ncbi:MAG: hypothetical protein R6U19_08905, partial [Bacteroidales bacterium]
MKNLYLKKQENGLLNPFRKLKTTLKNSSPQIFKPLILLTLLFLLSLESSGQNTLVKYPFTGDSPAATDVASKLSASDFHLTGGNISYGNHNSSSWTGSGTPYAQGCSGWDAKTPESAKYFSFVLTADITKIFDITRFGFEYRASVNGPSAFTIMIDTIVLDTVEIIEDITTVYDTIFSTQEFCGLTETEIKIMGWDNGSRTTGGGGDFRINDVKLEGNVHIRPVVIDFDHDERWASQKQGSSNLSSYATDHTYEDLGIFCTGGNAMRNGTTDKDGFPSALGEYSWRLQDAENVSWAAQLNRSGTIHGFGLKVRRWDDAIEPDYSLEYSTDGGSSYSSVATINNSLLNDSSNWMHLSYDIDPAQTVLCGDFKIRIAANPGNNQQIMVDEIEYTFECTEPAGWQITNEDQLYTIDFNNTVTGVNNKTYRGRGFSFAPAPGELDSRTWSISGMSDGKSGFGELKRQGDFSRGESSGAQSTGGIYAFQVDPGNNALGFQQTDNDFTPGQLTLKVLNQTGNTINSLSLAFKVWQYNDQDRSGSINLSYSTDNQTYTALPALNFTSEKGETSTASWEKNQRIALIQGLNISDTEHFYLKWTTDDAGGSGARDQFALDNIQLVANPANTRPPLKGTYQTIAVATEELTALDEPLTITDTLKLSNTVISPGTHELRFEKGAVAVGHGTQSYINGTIIKTGNDNFTFPAGYRNGQKNHYGQVSINNNSGDPADEFSVHYTYDIPKNRDAFHPSNHNQMESVSSLEYWEISRETGNSTPDITLHYNENDDGTSEINNNPHNLCIAHWNSTLPGTDKWEDIGNNNPNGGASEGSVTALNVDAFSV